VKDPIVAEVRAIRAKIAEQCGFDLDRIIDHAARSAATVSTARVVTKEEMRKRRAVGTQDNKAASG
jgi:hypothetical protein